MLEEIRIKLASKMVSKKDRANLYRKLAVMYSAGVGVQASIEELLRRRIELRGRFNPLSIMLDRCHRVLSNGGFEKGLEGFAGDSEIMLIASGEDSGDLGVALNEAADLLDFQRDFKRDVSNLLGQPVMLLSATFFVAIFLGVWFVPNIVNEIPKQMLNEKLLTLKAFSEFLNSEYGLILLFVIFGILALVWISMRHLTGPFRIFLDKFPPWSIYRLIVGSGWLIAITSMLNAGITLKTALQGLLRRSDNEWLNERLKAVMNELGGSSSTLGEALRKAGHEFPDNELISDIEILNKYSSQQEALSQISKEWRKEGQIQIKRKTAIIKYISIFIAFIVIGYVGLAVIQISDIQTLRSM